jgi:hypothetical protein
LVRKPTDRTTTTYEDPNATTTSRRY